MLTSALQRLMRGRDGEDRAAAHLQHAGLKLLARNVRFRGGELDLVMQEQEALVFVEVRVRNNTRYGSAAETVTTRKQQRVILAAQLYLQKHPEHQCRACRFDVVSITGKDLQWLKNAFST
jgi:putative endonuclease